MNSPSDPPSTDSEDRLRQFHALQGTAGQGIGADDSDWGPKSLDKSGPIARALGSISNEQLREIASNHQPPTTWFEQQEENLF